MDLTADFLRHLLHYDPLTGTWIWMNPLPRSRMRRGDVAGRITQDGRRQIRIASGFYYSARLAFLYMTGKWPKEQVDHINRIRDDDRWENLREASCSKNNFNKILHEINGIWRGITAHGNKFKVDVGGLYYGLYDTFEEAVYQRDVALKSHAGSFAKIPERTTT